MSAPHLPKEAAVYFFPTSATRRVRYLFRGGDILQPKIVLCLHGANVSSSIPNISVAHTAIMDPSAAMSAIDVGSLQAIFQNTPGRAEQPVVQCVQIKPMQQSNGEATERYRVVFSDTKYYVQTMLATSINEEIRQDRLKKGVIAQLLNYQANNVKGKR